jgi:hypothetical protein
MLHDWGVIAAASPISGCCSYRQSRGPAVAGPARPRRHGDPSAVAGDLLHFLTSFGSVGFATRTVPIFAIYVGPILMIGLCTPLLRRVISPCQVAEHHLDRRLHRRALRQEPGGGGNGGPDRDRRIGSLYRTAAQGDRISLETILAEDKVFSRSPSSATSRWW